MNRVFIVTTSVPDASLKPGQEAAGAFVADFAEALSRQADVTVIAPGGRDADESCSRVTVRRFAVPRLPLSLLEPVNPLHWLSIIKTLRSGMLALNSAVSRQRPDHIFALWALPSGFWANRLWHHRGIPYSTWALGSDIWSLGRVPIVRSVLRRVLREGQIRFADGVRLSSDVKCLSEMDCRFLPSSRVLPDRQLKRISGQPPFRIAFLGRWHPNKGVDILLESLSRLAEEDWHRIQEVRVCGGGPLEQLVHDRCTTMSRAGRPVTVGGYLNKNEAADLMGWADYLVLPSRIESIPVVFSDAMQSGCPIVCTPVGDLQALNDRYRIGEVADDVTPGAFCDALRRILRRAPDEFAAGLTAAAHDFSPENAAAEFMRQVFGDQEATNLSAIPSSCSAER